MANNAKYSEDEIERKRLSALCRKELSRKLTGSQGNSSNLNFLSINNGSSGNVSTVSPCREQRSGNSFVMHSPSRQNHRYNPLKSKDPQNFSSKSSTIQIKFVMISDERFSVIISEFQEQIISIFKTIPSRSYDLKTKTWDFHVKDYNDLVKKLSQLKPRVSIENLPPSILQVFKKEVNTDYNSVDLTSIDKKLVESLMPFQREGVCYGILKNGRCIIADEMGLGKTIQALGIVHYYRNDWPLLIVSPSSVRYQWSEAIYTFLPSVPTHYVHHYTTAKDTVGDAKIVIMSYDILKRTISSLERHVFGAVIFDESHFLKSPKSARSVAASVVASQARRVVLLSGTPALSRPKELYFQINLVMQKFLGFHEFGIRYCAGTFGKFGWEYGGSSNMQELQLLLNRCCLIRRIKSEVLTQLPSKIREVVILDPKLIKTETQKMKKIAEAVQRESFRNSEGNTALLQHYRETAEVKTKAICNYVNDLLESDTKFLIFAHHLTVLNEICKTISSKNVSYIRIDGSTKSEERKVRCDMFQEQDDCLVAVLSITAASTGITLTAAQRVVFAELYWNPGILCQAEDRVHRIGQQGSVLIQFLIAKNTADDHLWKLMQTKLNVLNKAGLGQNFAVEKSTEAKRGNETPSNQSNLHSFFAKASVQQDSAAHREKIEDVHQLLEEDDDALITLNLDGLDEDC
ncbi:SWI/SNF-related matrix-associated actin-dependent regulator of chromatin subfamily A-like protein 1 isoform X1 [Neodiprion lecontei]|uniref:SWI/SNF-related matrix-associated actin-dependent regulator of chromatin subfamily A-like protein 1 n=1 Tax=Neodiprion lecontei TaxID=441921 RepID=A0A6J0B2G7_NEOLC|nr:SWI/SNF-related matrix-associated actin-dependent regulator of chromatin subfamily A-like protein 1 isoform X1 [Neodiprion lecontei]XP_046586393.1 SWI/SNF-related matrix-associated actin-dependent regulator of chromatin subfamily A-like protein 1 isoform X1 [Neodiprion lecontei]